MKDILIRDVPDEVVAALSEKARAADMDRQDWLREHLKELASQPVLKKRYVLKAFGPEASFATIRRLEDSAGGGASNLDQEQMSAYNLAQEFVKRNAPGDREEAIAKLKAHFEQVFETVM
ncbi:MAG TPA: hypothetical protein VHV10_02225 [Ktedonobacteraceae bacterium]|jgi:hypothetical protein|nr:hypothetical protein [Ktedonobacteraceae bacterium]